MRYSSKNKQNSYNEFFLIILNNQSGGSIWSLLMIDYETSANSQHYLSVHYHLLVSLSGMSWLPVLYMLSLWDVAPSTSQASFPCSSICDYSTICNFHFPIMQFVFPQNFAQFKYWFQFLLGLIIPWGIEIKTYLAGCKQSTSINFGKEKIVHQGRMEKVWK